MGSFSLMSPELGKLQQLPSCSSSSVDKPSHGKKSVLQDVPASPVEPLRVALPAVAENTDSRGFTLKSVLHYRLPLGSSLRKSWETYLKRSDHEVLNRLNFLNVVLFFFCMLPAMLVGSILFS